MIFHLLKATVYGRTDSFLGNRDGGRNSLLDGIYFSYRLCQLYDGNCGFVGAIASLFLPQQYILLIGLWLLFSAGLIALSRRLFTPQRKISSTGDDSEATAISGILAGTVGRVIYEGNSWRAKCADETRDIAPNEVVYVLRKQGNTLIVLPSRMIDQIEPE